MARILAQVFGAVASVAFLIGGLGAMFLQVSGLPRRAASGLLHGGPAVVMGLALVSFAVFIFFSLCLPKHLVHLREDGQYRSLLAFGAFLAVAVLWGFAQRAV